MFGYHCRLILLQQLPHLAQFHAHRKTTLTTQFVQIDQDELPEFFLCSASFICQMWQMRELYECVRIID